MTTGTEANDNLTNDPSVAAETVNALGGNDVVTVQVPDGAASGGRTVAVDGGTGRDTLVIAIEGAWNALTGSGLGGSVQLLAAPGVHYTVSWASIERVEIRAAMSGGAYTTGDSIDILRIFSGQGGTLDTGAGNDEVYLWHDPAQGAPLVVNGGAGHDIVDFTAVTAANSDAWVAFGGEGNDILRGSAFNDRLDGAAGNDEFVFGAGLDQGDGGIGFDSLSADLGAATADIAIDLVANTYAGPSGTSFVNFEYFGGPGLVTGSGDDVVVTGVIERADTVTLGAGDDVVTFANGFDTVYGGAGAGAADSGLDTLVLDWSQAALVRNQGNIAVTAAGASGMFTDAFMRRVTFEAIDRFVITTGVANDNITTAGGNDEIRTGEGGDIINAAGGDDLIDGGEGGDFMIGGPGNDLFFVDDTGDSANEGPGGGTDTVSTSLSAFELGANFENLIGSSAFGQTLTGNSENNVVTAGAGNDVLHLWVGGGDDMVSGGAGMDNIFFGATLTSADVINGGAGVDTLVVQGPYGALTLTANITQIENLSILGGNNTNFGEPGTNRHDYVVTTHDANFAAGVQARVNGAALLEGEDFTFNGSAETDASFVVYGGKGKDTLLGGFGHDIFIYPEERFAPGDTVNGGPGGYDGIFFRGNYTIDFNAAGYVGLMTGIENMTLTSATDERYARGGGTEFDYNITLADNMTLPGVEITVSGALLMATETMILDASLETDGNVRLFAGKADDTLKGSQGADLLFGNLGADALTGNGGADLFRFQATSESTAASMDHIADFTPGTDRIELDRVDADSLAAGDQAFTFIGADAFTGSAGQLRAYQSGDNWFVEGDVDGDMIADLVIALTLQGSTPLSAGDFIL